MGRRGRDTERGRRRRDTERQYEPFNALIWFDFQQRNMNWFLLSVGVGQASGVFLCLPWFLRPAILERLNISTVDIEEAP